ncbi:hypothetical protein GCM10017083_31250 [Thalassobaculum fulvum]|jgi:hypothetical protein|uniref:Cell division protein FtsL n=1 Tax=Thalassobaculum fulvum TaxID=1633335 RepID=A0A919CQS3_9PROT|nr:hypothetical protein [Thalassobaculum fulvum]GHD54109.1 hypothetical protein GCM10017083_31250 [Thalassobaculum fulvum]
MRRATILWFLIATCLGVALFLVKHEVQRREEQLAGLHRQILASQEAIHVLEAEWSYLNRPDRIEALVRRHLNLVPMDTRRIGSVEMLPMRLPMPDAAEDGVAPTLAGLPPLPVGRPLVLTREARR